MAAEDTEQAGHDRQHGQRHPVGRVDAEKAAAGIVADRRAARTAGPVGNHRSVQQEGGEHEEDRDHAVEADDQPVAEGVAEAAEAAGEEPDVDDDDGDGGDAPHSVREGKEAVARPHVSSRDRGE